MKNKYRILKITITVIILGFLLYFSLNRFDEQMITDEKLTIKMDNSVPVYFIDEKDVATIVKKENPSNKVGDLDIPKLEKMINDLPAVDSANVYLNLNANLNIDIKQKMPVFRYKNGTKDFYVDEKGREFPITRRYSHPTMLVTGNITPKEYPQIISLIKKIEKDHFSKEYFVGIRKYKNDYQLLTSEGNFKVELGDLENIDFKIKGFKTFVEKYLVFQDLGKYSKVSLKFQNQIVTTLNPNFAENDSILQVGRKELEKIASAEKPKNTQNN